MELEPHVEYIVEAFAINSGTVADKYLRPGDKLTSYALTSERQAQITAHIWYESGVLSRPRIKKNYIAVRSEDVPLAEVNEIIKEING